MSDAILKSGRLKFAVSLICFLFTFALVSWWWVFSLRQLTLLVDVLTPEKFDRLHRMLIWEGSVLVAAVFFGGSFLLVLMNREVSRNRRLRSFFSNFTHDLKTSLTRLRLTTEVLADKNQDPELQRIMEEVNRLDLQLENSLWMARIDSNLIRVQPISLNKVIAFLRVEWPALEIKLNKDAFVLADEQALKSVFRNLFQNASLHGQAKSVQVTPVLEKNTFRIAITDDGVGFAGNYSQLGSQLFKSKNQQGNGLGLYLTRDLLKKMQGQIHFVKADTGFKVEVILPAAPESKAN
ncbi:MAG: HAMP domain-containing histidine kinase [Bdellovibrio sp.]|nr:HAMP domain-containing histidine kinase [Bdellovibrio sp.]